MSKDQLRYMEDKDGVHVMHPIDEGTLCGELENERKATRKKVVTCPTCIWLLKKLRDVKFKEQV